MIGRTLKRLFARFGYRYGYDTSYMQNLVDSDRNGATKLALASLFTRYRFGLPPAHYFAAKIMATRYADCGSCLKLAIDMAAEAGVPLAHIRRLLLGPEEEAPPEMRLAARYARAVSENDPALSDIIEDWCVQQRLDPPGYYRRLHPDAGGNGDSPAWPRPSPAASSIPCSNADWDTATPVRRCWRGCA